MSPNEEFEAERSNIVILVRAALALFGSLLGLILSLPILVLGLPFWITAVGTRLIARRLVPRTVRWQEIIEFDFRFGWKPKPNLNVQCFGDDVFRVTTGPDGWRRNISLAECDIVVLGDSFAFGYGVNDQAMFSELIPNVRVKPIGAPGYNLVQELLVLRDYSSQLTGKLIVWFVFLGNDPWDNLYPYMQNHTTPFLRRVNIDGDWQIETSHISAKTRPYKSQEWHDQHIREMLADLCSATYIAERAYSACEHLIREAQSICDNHGSRLCVFTVPDRTQLSIENLERLRECSSSPESFNPALPDLRISEICDKLGVMFVAGRDHLNKDDYRIVDRHWNETGHRRVAEILGKLPQKRTDSSRRV